MHLAQKTAIMPTILDVPLDTLEARDIKNHLYYLLGNLESGDAFATSGVHSKAPLPDLSLHGFGRIPLPLAERDADAICREPTDVDQGK